MPYPASLLAALGVPAPGEFFIFMSHPLPFAAGGRLGVTQSPFHIHWKLQHLMSLPNYLKHRRDFSVLRKLDISFLVLPIQ